MTYFSARGIAAMTMCAGLSLVLSIITSLVFRNPAHMPFLCGIVGSTSSIPELVVGQEVRCSHHPDPDARVHHHPLLWLFHGRRGLRCSSTAYWLHCLEKPMSSMIGLSAIPMATAGAVIGLPFTSLYVMAAIYGGVEKKKNLSEMLFQRTIQLSSFRLSG